MPARITIKEIAKKANVSIGTVDRVLHNRGRVAEKTKDKILAIAKKGNYQSNIYARHLKLNRTYELAVLLPDDNPYWDKHRMGAERASRELSNMGVSVSYHLIDNTTEESRYGAIQSALISNPDGLIITPTMMKEGGKPLETLSELEIPYVFVDSAAETAKYLSFIGQDAFQSGRLAGQILSSPFVKNAKFVVLTYTSVDLQKKTIKARIAGFQAFLKDSQHNTANMINMEVDDLNENTLRQKLKELGQPINLFVPNSKAYKAAELIAHARDPLQLRILGFDLIDQNVELLESGKIDFIIDQQPIDQGYQAVQTLYKHLLLNTEVNKNQFLPLAVITKENLKYCDY